MKDQERILKYLDGQLSESEQNEFTKTADYQFIEQVTQSLQAFKAPKIDAEELLLKIKQEHNANTQSKLISLWPTVWKVAATLVMVSALAIWLYIQNGSLEQVIASHSDRREWTLPDASKVTLNKQSSISYFSEDWDTNRYLKLEGEAYFEVEKGSKFTVKTTAGDVSVLGTRFVVISRPDYYEVTCYEGKVSVTENAHNHQYTLTAGDQVRWINGSFSENVGKGDAPAWRSGYSDFKDLPFGLVVKELERQFDVVIAYPDSEAQKLFTGSFEHKELNSALKAITIPLSLEFLIKGDSVTLSK